MSQSRAVLSKEPVRNSLPSLENLTDVILPLCPLKTWLRFSFRSQSFAVQSPEPVTILVPSGEKATAFT